jgi:hypothetical protein
MAEKVMDDLVNRIIELEDYRPTNRLDISQSCDKKVNAWLFPYRF